MPRITLQYVRCPVCGVTYGVRSDQPLDQCRLPKCKAKVQLEKVNGDAWLNRVQQGKPYQRPNPSDKVPVNTRTRWRRRRKPDTVDPPRGRTLSTPAEVGEIRGPDPVLLQPDQKVIPVGGQNAAPASAVPAAKGGLSFGMLLFIGLMVLLFAGIAYMANSVWGDGGGLGGGGGSNRCAEMRSKIKSFGPCYGQGYCSAGWSQCVVRPFDAPEGDGCIPNECR